MDELLPDAAPYVTLLLELSDEEFRRWQHSPITAAFLRFQDDQIANWQEVAIELLEAGAFRLNDPHEDRNPDVVRGKILALKALRGITLTGIQGFYGKEPPDSQDDQADAAQPRGVTGYE